MPGKRFIKIMTNKVEHINAHTNSINDTTITAKIFEVSNKDKFEEHNRINAVLTFGTIILCGCFIHRPKIEATAQLAVKVIFRHMLGQLEGNEKLFGWLFSALHDSNLRIRFGFFKLSLL